MEDARGSGDIFSTTKDQFFLEGLGDSDTMIGDPQRGTSSELFCGSPGPIHNPQGMLMDPCVIDEEAVMKASVPIVFICLTALLIAGGCSREEPPPPPPQKSKVVRPIKLPPRQEAPAEEAKAEPRELKPPPVEEQALPQAEAGEEEPEEGAGYYIVKRGDSLSAIAVHVYRDSLKWPFLYRDNMDLLGSVPSGEVLPDSQLPEGLRLKVTSPDEVAANLKGRPQELWVVNVLSTTATEKLNPPALRLLKGGYPIYITRATVKGRQWMRLRIGFFTEREEAKREGRKIMAMLHLRDSWVTKIGEGEREEFGGY